MLRTSCILFALARLVAPATSQNPPNIVFLFADDLGWTDLAGPNTTMGNGSAYYRTPNIDALAAAGMSFDNAYSCGPNCAPTRAALMSGQYAARTGIYTVNSSNRGQSQFRLLEGAPNTTTMSPAVVTMAETLKAAGYATGHFGKWHLGADSAGQGPLSQGFDVNAGGTAVGSVSGGSSGHFARSDGSWNLPGLPANNVPNQFMADRLTDEALAWMGTTTGTPFFCYLTHFSVHTPIQAPAADVAAFNGVPPSPWHDNQTYAGMMKNLDDNVGRVVTFLETTPDPANPGHELIDNTVVIFYSDNGGLGGYATAGITGGSEITHQYPLKSGKGSLCEGGIRVPLIVRWDGRVASNAISHEPVLSVDFHPTLAALAGAALPGGQMLDGVDFAPLVLGQATSLNRGEIFWHFPAYLDASSSLGTWRTTPVSVIRRDDWKLHFYYETRHWELYDLAADLGEDTDLAAANPALVQSMGSALSQWLANTNADLPRHKGTTTEVPLPGTSVPQSDTVDWQQLSPPTSPPATGGHGLVATATDLLLFGGEDASGLRDTTFRFDGTTWSQLSLPLAPPARRDHAMAFDALRGRVVVFGGAGSGAVALGDTWQFDGSAWSQSPAIGPGARRGAAMTFDAARGECVLFGGQAGAAALADTWTFDGATWTQASPATAPTARSEAVLVWASSHGASVLFGGRDGSGTALADTWSWDGSTWNAQIPATSPPSRHSAAAAWDATRERLVVYGGVGAGGTARDDTWEFDGATWRPRTPATVPPAWAHADAAFEAGGQRLILCGGDGAAGPTAETWQYESLGLGSATPYGTGCSGSAGTPVLLPAGAPWIAETFQATALGLPQPMATVAFVIGFSDATIPGGALPYSLAPHGAPGCAVLASLDAVALRTTFLGHGTFGLSIPDVPSLVGLSLYEQLFALDAAANTLGLTASNGVRLTIGAR